MVKYFCVFDPAKECGARAELHSKTDQIAKLCENLKPAADNDAKKILKPMEELISQLSRDFQGEFQTLHHYCVICRKPAV
jgi:hypothetical protein